MLREKLTKNLDLAFFGGNLVSDSVKRNVSFVDAVRYSPLNVGFTTIFEMAYVSIGSFGAYALTEDIENWPLYGSLLVLNQIFGRMALTCATDAEINAESVKGVLCLPQ